MTPYTLDEAHEQISAIYKWFAQQAPGVTPQETGELRSLWAIADQLHEEEGVDN